VQSTQADTRDRHPVSHLVRLIYYSLARTADGRYDRQWIQSIRSLRRCNRSIAVCLVVFNGVSADLLREAERWQVMLLSLGDYREWMRRRAPAHGGLLADYPTLHKFLVLSEADTRGVSAVLYVDCDTFFFDDPDLLFDACGSGHWHAREAPGSRLCPHGPDVSNVNEELIDAITYNEGLHKRVPFNSGVCVLNHHIWETFLQLQDVFFDFSWRLLVGMQYYECGAADDAGLGARVSRAASKDDWDRALPYPSNNAWILEEIAYWLSLGRVHDLSQHLIGRDLVAQGYEFDAALANRELPVVAHYFSCFQRDFFRRVAPIDYV
jgi:hypothetical protein